MCAYYHLVGQMVVDLLAEELKDHYILTHQVNLQQPYPEGVHQVMTVYIQHPLYQEIYELVSLEFTDAGTIIQYEYLPNIPITTKEQLYGSLWVLCHLFKSVMGNLGSSVSSLDETQTPYYTPPITFGETPVVVNDPDYTPPQSDPPERVEHCCPGPNQSDDGMGEDYVRDPSCDQVLEAGGAKSPTVITAFSWI
jgi:hypothetical protein